jgi:hypothetical protein
MKCEELSFNKETRYIKNISGFSLNVALEVCFGPVGFRAFPFQKSEGLRLVV